MIAGVGQAPAGVRADFRALWRNHDNLAVLTVELGVFLPQPLLETGHEIFLHNREDFGEPDLRKDANKGSIFQGDFFGRLINQRIGRLHTHFALRFSPANCLTV